MRVLNAVRRVLLLLVLIPVLAIVLDTLLRMLKAQRSNAIVSSVRDFANIFLIEPFRTVFPDQSYLQDALVALAAFGLLALLIIFVFRGLRAMVGTRPPRVRNASSDSKTTSTTKKKTTTDTTAAAPPASADKTEAEKAKAEDDTKSTSA